MTDLDLFALVDDVSRARRQARLAVVVTTTATFATALGLLVTTWVTATAATVARQAAAAGIAVVAAVTLSAVWAAVLLGIARLHTRTPVNDAAVALRAVVQSRFHLTLPVGTSAATFLTVGAAVTDETHTAAGTQPRGPVRTVVGVRDQGKLELELDGERLLHVPATDGATPRES